MRRLRAILHNLHQIEPDTNARLLATRLEVWLMRTAHYSRLQYR